MATNEPSTDEYPIQVHRSTGEKLYLNEKFADFHFIIKSKSGDGQIERIPVHKVILGTASDVFEVMFNGSWREKVDVEIVDASADSFKEFLQFFYLPKAKVTIENVAEVMNLGKKYDVAECFNVCGQFLQEHLTDDDICVVYELAIHLEHKELEIQCEEYIGENAQAVFESESLLNSDQKTVKRILQMDVLNCSEAELLESLMKWLKVKAETEELTKEIFQGKFSNLLHEIRFRSITLDEFLSFDSLYGALLTSEELNEIVRMIHSKQFQPKIFKADRRINLGSIQWNKDDVIKCDRFDGGNITKPYFIKKIETTTFTVNKPVLLGAFMCISIYNFEINYNFTKIKCYELDDNPQIEITISKIPDSINSSIKVVLHNEKTRLNISSETRISLSKPILIHPRFKYEIQIKIENLQSTWSTIYQFKPEVNIEKNITVQFRNDPTIDNMARGIIRKIDFNRI